MKHLYEQGTQPGDAVYSEAHAKELLNVQANYNKMLQELNNRLAKQKSDLAVKYMKLAQTQAAQKAAATTAKTTTAPTTQQAAATGTVTTAGQPVNAQGNPGTPKVESYPDILRIKELNEVEDKYAHIPHNMRNWYQKPEAQEGYEEPEKIKTPRRKKITSKVQNQMLDIEGEIDDLKSEIKWTKEKFESPTYEGIEGEIEQFFAEIGSAASEILNSGAHKDDEEKAYALREVGVENPEEIIQNYYYYYPEFNPELDKEREKAEEKIKKLKDEVEQLETKLSKLEEMYESVNEGTFNTEKVDPYELQDLKDYLDAENISYSEDEDTGSLDFDETELDKEWKDKMDSMGMEENVPEETDDILSMEDDDGDIDGWKDSEGEWHYGNEEDIDITAKDEKIDEEKVFYVKVDDEAEQFIGKIYKLFDEGDWRSKIVDGESETFEKLNYDPDWDEVDIIAFLRENYADAELVSEDEFNDHVEEPEAEPETEENTEVEENKNEPNDMKKLVRESVNESKESKVELDRIYNYFLKVNVSKLDKDKRINKLFLLGYEGKELPVTVNAGTPFFIAWQAGQNRRNSHTKQNVDGTKESQQELDKIQDYFIRVNVSDLDKDKEINRMFLRGYEGKDLPPIVNANTPNFVAWQAGRKRRSTNEHQIPTLDDYLNETK